MRLLVFSDNHRNREILKRIITAHPDAEQIISLGDSEMSEGELTALSVFGVKGNYPFEPQFPSELNLTYAGIRFLFVHGHEDGVKTGLSRLIARARARQADVVFYGHTHALRIDDLGELLLVNPGALTFPRSGHGPTYAIVDVTGEVVEITIMTAPAIVAVDRCRKTFGKEKRR